MACIERAELIERRFFALTVTSGAFQVNHAAIETAGRIQYARIEWMPQRLITPAAVAAHS